jgi:hypothetical protein
MNKLPRDQRSRIILVGLATAMAAGVLWAVLISPLRDQAARVARRIEDSRSKVEMGSKNLSTSNQVGRALGAVTEQLAKAESSMASGDLYAWMIQTMNRFKTPYAVEIPQISREIPSDVGVFPDFPYKAATFVVRGTGCYHDLGQFLADFENSFPYMRVQNLELDSAGGAKVEDPEKLQFKLEFVTLVKPMAP